MQWHWNNIDNTEWTQHYCAGIDQQGNTHQSGTGPPLWTFDHIVARTAGRVPLLCPPENTTAASVKTISHRNISHLTTSDSFWATKVFHFLDWFILGKMRCGAARQQPSAKLFIGHSYPETHGLRWKAATATKALMTSTMWINNGRRKTSWVSALLVDIYK